MKDLNLVSGKNRTNESGVEEFYYTKLGIYKFKSFDNIPSYPDVTTKESFSIVLL